MNKNLKETAKELMQEFDLKPFEAFQIATRIEFNQLYKSANVIVSDNSVPTAFESIAISLKELKEEVGTIAAKL